MHSGAEVKAAMAVFSDSNGGVKKNDSTLLFLTVKTAQRAVEEEGEDVVQR